MSAQTKAPAAANGPGRSFKLRGNSSEVQRARLIEALRQGTVSTLDARTSLDVMHPAGRVMELRRQGHSIETHWSTESTGATKHRVARYVLRQERRHGCLARVDAAEPFAPQATS